MRALARPGMIAAVGSVLLGGAAARAQPAPRCLSGHPAVQKVFETFAQQALSDPTSFDPSLSQPTTNFSVRKSLRNALLVADDAGLFESTDWQAPSLNVRPDAKKAIEEIYTLYYRYQPDKITALVVNSAFPVTLDGFFYLPLSNNILGIGYQRWVEDTPIFDFTTGVKLEGFAHMNDFRLMQALPSLESAFCQELGHRWGPFISYRSGDGGADSILGRDTAHWSFFLDVGHSAMEGNVWLQSGEQQYTTDTHTRPVVFAPIDLYLMGLVSANEVPPIYLLERVTPVSTEDNCGRPIGPTSCPSAVSPTTVQARRRTRITIEDVIAAEGRRNPSTGPTTYNVSFLLVVRPSQVGDGALLAEYEQLVDRYVAAFNACAGGKMTMVNHLLPVAEAPPGSTNDAGIPIAPPPTGNVGLGGTCEGGVLECNRAAASYCARATYTQPRICTNDCTSTATAPAGWCCTRALGSTRTFLFPPEICAEAARTAALGSGSAPIRPSFGSSCPGCTVAASTAAAALALLALLAALLLRRRARPRHPNAPGNRR